MVEMVPTSNPTMSRLRANAIHGVLWLGSQRIGDRILGQVFSIILVRLLVPRDYGLIAMASVFSGLLQLFTHMGISSAIIQRRDLDDEYLSTAFWANLGVGIVLFTLAAASSKFLGIFLREPLAGTLVIFLSCRFVIEATSITQLALISRHLRYRALSFRAWVATIVGGVIGIGMAYAGMGVWSLVGQTLGTSTTATIAMHQATGWRPKFVFSWRKFADLFSFSGPLLLSRFFGYSIRNVDNLLIGRYLGSVALGFYALAYTVFLIPVVDIGFPVSQVLFSSLSRVQEDADRLKRGFLLATKYVTMIALPMMVGLSLVAPLLVEILFGRKWLPAAPVMSILALAGFLQLMTSLGPSGLQAVGRTDLQMRWSILGALLYLPAFALGLRWGIVGVAIGYLAATAALTPIQYGFVARVLGVRAREMWAVVYPSVIGCAMMAAVVGPVKWVLMDIRLPRISMLALLIVLGALVYCMIMWNFQRQAVVRLLDIIREARSTPSGRQLRKAEET